MMAHDETPDQLTAALGGLAAPLSLDLTTRLFGRWTTVPGPVGELFLAYTDVGVSYIRTAASVRGRAEVFREHFHQRFNRPLQHVAAVPAGLFPDAARAQEAPVDLRTLTSFERDVLTATREIPVGQVRPYAWIAKAIGRPKAVRAVGTALGNNPVPVLIPCHRVVRADGHLGQYVFGADVKEDLLRAEESNVDEMRALADARRAVVGHDGVVCYPSCDRIRSVPAASRRAFRTVAQAVQAGYRPCERCGPVA
ncbi:methylated-DNA--[protein]-cysteine S-methyltransferase [Actinokineospora auranticolor]|uniref:methylated-DNA--[protein]-cysteine S-methyltransferase n=1 Tax=Actinokineospora auranticolor TaxID=155976 RepID=A0A2S6GI39_9PSEU|nr:methylated-DNA--[protein]-cysteine S-methyltransferase [Actinokineospora auranticolor]PPK64894.1 O-6-methylguanine DNA methyltransferase [Actinokineospora auranticolor]